MQTMRVRSVSALKPPPGLPPASDHRKGGVIRGPAAQQPDWQASVEAVRAEMGVEPGDAPAGESEGQRVTGEGFEFLRAQGLYPATPPVVSTAAPGEARCTLPPPDLLADYKPGGRFDALKPSIPPWPRDRHGKLITQLNSSDHERLMKARGGRGPDYGDNDGPTMVVLTGPCLSGANN